MRVCLNLRSSGLTTSQHAAVKVNVAWTLILDLIWNFIEIKSKTCYQINKPVECRCNACWSIVVLHFDLYFCTGRENEFNFEIQWKLQKNCNWFEWLCSGVCCRLKRRGFLIIEIFGLRPILVKGLDPVTVQTDSWPVPPRPTLLLQHTLKVCRVKCSEGKQCCGNN